MSYTPTTWQTGDTITAAGLNKIEQGIANAGGSSYDLVISADSYPLSSGTNYSILSGSSTAVYNKLADRNPNVTALLVYDFTSATFPATMSCSSYMIESLSTEGAVLCSFADFVSGEFTNIRLVVEPDGTVYRD